MAKPSVGIFGLTGCAGDQLAILNCEDELLELVSILDVKDFLLASSANDTERELDVAMVEGAVLSRRDEKALQRIRERSRTLVAIGTCAVWGGVAAMDRDTERGRLLDQVYGETGRQYDTMSARPLSDVVRVDLKITGCPIEKEQFLSAVSSLLNGDAPLFPDYPVCGECKMHENNCVLIERNEVCCGPLTVAGCNARCPELSVACVGCRGPVDDANTGSALAMFEQKGIARGQVAKKLRTFAPVPIEVAAGNGGAL